MEVSFQNIPEEMKQYPHWLVWRLEDVGREKPNKTPYSVNGGYGKTNDPNTWGTFEDAVRLYNDGKYNGIGFVFTDTPFVGIDIDAAVDQGTGRANSEAQDIIEQAGSYTELSQSKKGFHVIVRGSLPDGRRRKGAFEMYGDGSPRYFAMTGEVWEDRRDIVENQIAIDQIHKKYIESPKQEYATPKECALNLSDSEVVSKASNSKHGYEFTELYSGNWRLFC